MGQRSIDEIQELPQAETEEEMRENMDFFLKGQELDKVREWASAPIDLEMSVLWKLFAMKYSKDPELKSDKEMITELIKAESGVIMRDLMKTLNAKLQ